MGDLIVAVVGGLMLLVELCVRLVVLAVETLAFAFDYLVHGKSEGKPRAFAKRLMLAFAPLVIVLVVLVGSFIYADWRAKVRERRERETKQEIEHQLRQLVASVDEDGHLIRQPTEFLAVEDAWGNELRVRYNTSLLHETVNVCSDGADETPDTIDDLNASKQKLRPKQEIAEDAIDKAKDAFVDRFLKRD